MEKPVTAHDLAVNNVKYDFGIDPEKCAAALRRLADEVESRVALPQTFISLSRATSEDFTLATYRFTIARRNDQAQP